MKYFPCPRQRTQRSIKLVHNFQLCWPSSRKIGFASDLSFENAPLSAKSIALQLRARHKMLLSKKLYKCGGWIEVDTFCHIHGETEGFVSRSRFSRSPPKTNENRRRAKDWELSSHHSLIKFDWNCGTNSVANFLVSWSLALFCYWMEKEWYIQVYN